MSFPFDKLRKHLNLVLILVFILPVLFSTIYKDDMVHSLRYYNQSGNISVAIDAVREDIGNLLRSGRFNPVLSFLGVFTFHFINHDSFVAYKILQYVLISGTMVLFCSYVNKEIGYKASFLVVLMLLSQTAMDPNYHDPYLSYNFLMPLVTLLLFGAFFLYDRFLNDENIFDLIISLVLYCLALLTYELAYPFLLVFIILTAIGSSRNIAAWCSLGLILLFMIVLQVVLRASVEQVVYYGVSFSLKPLAIIRTFIHQAFAAVPLARIWGRVGRFVFTRTQNFYLREISYCAVLAALFFHFIIKIVKLFRVGDRNELLSVLGMLTWLLPAVPIALSLKYQNELSLMRGYLPRYLQNFGFCLYVLPYLAKINSKRFKLAAAVLSLFALSTFGYNVERIHHANQKYYASRILFYFVEDGEFLNHNKAERIHILKNYAYWPETYLSVNPNVTLVEDQDALPGDFFLLISEGNKEDAFAYWGRYGLNGVVEDIYKVEYNKKHENDELLRIKDWQLIPLQDNLSYDELVDTLNI